MRPLSKTLPGSPSAGVSTTPTALTRDASMAVATATNAKDGLITHELRDGSRLTYANNGEVWLEVKPRPVASTAKPATPTSKSSATIPPPRHWAGSIKPYRSKKPYHYEDWYCIPRSSTSPRRVRDTLQYPSDLDKETAAVMVRNLAVIGINKKMAIALLAGDDFPGHLIGKRMRRISWNEIERWLGNGAHQACRPTPRLANEGLRVSLRSASKHAGDVPWIEQFR